MFAITATWKVLPTAWTAEGGTMVKPTGAAPGRVAGAAPSAPVLKPGVGLPGVGICACLLSWPTMAEAATAAEVWPASAGRGRGMTGTFKPTAFGS